ncbi:MAG: thioesterase, partial [Armatimonadota bacterium]
WCRSRGFTYRSLEERGYFLPVVEVRVRYRGEVRYDDEILVRIRLAEVRRASLKFEYRVLNARTGAETTEGYTWHVLMSESRRAVSIPDHIRALLEFPP